ncbi:hypothetical protein QP166_05065 [Sphingomonas sp. LR60]|uniref:hypothetical protein n=1 Tax=Sphingomonas sp. LR60 TaxID=3050233 RepID=UPI002FE3F48B
MELQGPAALEASSGEWVAFQVADEGRPGARQVRVGAHRFLSRFADLRGLGTVEAARFLLTREGWDGAAEAGHWSVRFSDDRVLTMQLERARDGRLRCADRSLGKVACLSFDEGCAFPEPSGATGRTLYDPVDAPPLAVHDWSPGADYVAHVVRALAGADDPRLPELIAWLDLHREEKTGRVSAIGTDHELAFEALRSGDLAARLRADREVMAAYLAAARGDPQIAAAVEAAIAREAAHAREDARAAAEREFETELDGRRAEQAARIAAREAALAKAADERSSARERELSADLERRLAQRAAQGEDEARRHREEAAATVEAARSERERLEAECDALDARASELRSEADGLKEAARAAAERAAAAEREFAERARRGIATPGR